MNSVVAFGETLLRLKSPGAERLLQTSNLEATFGGAEMNVLAALSGWGTPTRFVTLLPEGPLGDAARREIAAHGIGGEHVMRTPGRLGIYFLEGGSGARAARITYDRSNSAFTQVESGSVPWKIVLRGAGWLHLTGITAALGEAPMRAAHVAAKLARECGITVSLDVNYRAQLWAGASVRPVDALQPLLECASIVFAGAGDGPACFGRKSPAAGANTRAGFERFAAQLLTAHANIQTVVGTLRQARAADAQKVAAACRERRGGCRWSRVHLLGNIVDRIGSGDALAAGFIHGRLRRWPTARTLEFAAAAAALKHTIAGDVARVTEEEVVALVEGRDPGRVLR